jgi:tetratricopeptide (TPR) repeat protein
MVLGDTVNTASRLQSIAAPGSVLVDDATRRASEAAIAYEEAGAHELKGREQPVRAWTALRVVAGARGARRSAGLEAPFVGRHRELQAMIEAGEESAREGKARLVAVVGEPGSGKSRLLWEFFKNLDGIEELRFWHQGRCLSYGEGVAYWALAEMVRSRARIEEEEDPASAREKLRAAVEEFVPEERERRLVEPRLAHLLRLEERPEADRVDLFSGWRLFFERMAATDPVILAFEDLQWADSGLLEFIDYLLEWSADFPIFVIALGRPELRTRRSSWEPLTLEPLEPQAIGQLLEGLAPGLPEGLVAQIVQRSEGIPLYAVETIRMLQDRGVLVQEGSRYVVKSDVSDLEVPETLHALVASRLDGLSQSERALLQDASVLGHSFTVGAVAALSGASEAEVAQVLDGLVAKQILSRDDDPRSPERGQYVFLQGLLRTVAYGTLARRARKTKHLAAAYHLEEAWPGEARDIAEVVASHYLEAIRSDPEAEDVSSLRASARERLTAAGQAAASLALGSEADRYFAEAADLAEDDLERAALFEQAGRALSQTGEVEAAEGRLRTAIELYERGGEPSGGRAGVALANLLRYLGRVTEAAALLEPFRATVHVSDRTVRAEALSELAMVALFEGDVDRAGPLIEEALTTLELEESWPLLPNALINRGIYLIYKGRRREGAGVLREALALAEQQDLPAVALRTRLNLSQLSMERDAFEDTVTQANEALAIARERGDRVWELRLIGNQLLPSLYALGRWDEVMQIGAPLLNAESDLEALAVATLLISIAAARGDEATVERCLSRATRAKDSTIVDLRVSANFTLARAAIESGATKQALSMAKELLSEESAASETIEDVFALSIEAAIALGDETALIELEAFVAGLPPARATPLLRSGRARVRAELAHRAGDEAALERSEDEALALLREVGARPTLARALIEKARRGQDAGALAEARSIYEDLGAARWLERIEQLSEVAA